MGDVLEKQAGQWRGFFFISGVDASSQQVEGVVFSSRTPKLYPSHKQVLRAT
jgi:hypothetical protein